MKLNLAEFKTDFLEASNNIDKVTRFWNKYNYKPFDLLNIGHHWQLRERVFSLLRTCKEIDSAAFARIHKGNPYYFIGISSYLLDDFQTAVYFFDASVTEDMNAGADPIDNPKPSTHFLMLEGEASNQSAKKLTEFVQAKVERALNYYQVNVIKSDVVSPLTIDKLRKDFIYRALTTKNRPGLRTLVTAFITFCIEWDFRKDHFEYGVGNGTSEPFFSHLFRGCILFESLLMHNPVNMPVGKNLGSVLTEKAIKEKLGIGEIKGKGGGEIFVLDDVFEELIKYDESIHETIKITYMARNTFGHNLGWDSNIGHDQYQKLYFIIVSACLHVIACLWK